MHYIIELVHGRTIVLQYFPTYEKIADIFELYLENVYLPLFTIGGEFIRVKLVNSLVFILRGEFVPTRFSSFPHLEFFSILELLYCKG